MRLLPRLRRREEPIVTGSFSSPEPAAPPRAMAEPPETRCTATTRKGSRCKLPASPGSDRCLMHPHAPPTPAAV